MYFRIFNTILEQIVLLEYQSLHWNHFIIQTIEKLVSGFGCYWSEGSRKLFCNYKICQKKSWSTLKNLRKFDFKKFKFVLPIRSFTSIYSEKFVLNVSWAQPFQPTILIVEVVPRDACIVISLIIYLNPCILVTILVTHFFVFGLYFAFLKIRIETEEFWQSSDTSSCCKNSTNNRLHKTLR